MTPYDVTHATPADVNKWEKAGYLKTDYAPSSQGMRRVFSRENLLEIAFMKALTRCGYSPADAAEIAALWLSDTPELFAFNPVTGARAPWVRPEASLAAIAAQIDDDIGTGEMVEEDAPPDLSLPADFRACTAMSVIWPREIVAQIDRFCNRAV